MHPPAYVVYTHTHSHTHKESNTQLISLQTSFCWRGTRHVGGAEEYVTSIHLFPLKWAARRSEPVTLAWNSCSEKQQNKAASQHTPHTGLSPMLLHNLAGKQKQHTNTGVCRFSPRSEHQRSTQCSMQTHGQRQHLKCTSLGSGSEKKDDNLSFSGGWQ